VRRRRRRVGADADFAKAMARLEFGRFYTDEQQQREVRRSLERAKPCRQPNEPEPEKKVPSAPPPSAGADKCKPKLWHRPRVRERRTELADGMAKLAARAKSRKERGEKE
jgi:hypothetical protein